MAAAQQAGGMVVKGWPRHLTICAARRFDLCCGIGSLLRRPTHGEATSMPAFRPTRQHPMPLDVFLNLPRPTSFSHLDAAFFPTVLLHTTAGTMVRGIGSRGGRLGRPPGRGRGGRRQGSRGGSRGAAEVPG
jgi:hypothetical protein